MRLKLLRMLLAAVLQALFISPIQLAVVARAVSSHSGDSLLSEVLPQWLEKRAVYDRWPGLREIDYEDLEAEQLLLSMEAQLARRSQERLNRIVQYLDFALPSDPPSDSTSTMSRNRRVFPKMAFASAVGGQAGRLNWHPILLGLLGSLCLLLLVVGAAVAYNQKVRLPRKKSKREHGQNGVGRMSIDDQDVSILRLDGDRKLAHSAQMYHYQYRKQQMLAVERANESDNQVPGEVGEDSDSDVMDGDFTVYECPGLASTGELEVQNPLFQGEALGCLVPPPLPSTVSTGANTFQRQGTSDREEEDEESSDSTTTSKTVEARQ